MNYAEDLRNKLNTTSSETINAVIYARVSTDNEGQKESCANQVELAKNYISQHPNIKLIGTYVDDGISGKNDFTRPEYIAMLQQISAGEVDLIITKALSRLHRDELNSLMFSHLLTEYNTTILTLEDNIVHDFEDMNSALLHSINYAIDAQYVKRQSLSGHNTQKLRIKRKELSAKDISYGYTWNKETKSISINLDEAEVIREIFEDYVYRNGTPASIKRTLKSKGIFKSERTISNIILDERYIGNFYINKRTSKLGTGQTKSKRIKLPKEQWVLVSRPDLQIVDLDLFELAGRIRKTRINIYEKPNKKAVQARFQGTHKYAGKIFCSICGMPFQFDYADRNKTIGIYKVKGHGDCINPINRIKEDEIEEITRKALKETIDQQNEVCNTLELVLTECVEASQNSGTEIEKLKKQRTNREQQIDSLIEALSEGGLTEAAKERIKCKINTITAEIDHLTETISDKESNKLDSSYVTDKIASIKNAIADLRNFTSMDRERILNYIERIELLPNSDINIILKSGQIINIDIQRNKNNDFTDRGGAGKMRKQDILYSHLSNRIFLTSFTYHRTLPIRRNLTTTVEITVNCYLLTD